MIPVYAAEVQVREYIEARYATEVFLPAAGTPEMLALIEDAEALVDSVSGPWPVYADGRRFSPPLLTAPQQDVLRRATAEAVAWLVAHDAADRLGASDVLPSELRLVRLAGRTPPRVLEVMAGSGLLLYSGTVGPDPVAVT